MPAEAQSTLGVLVKARALIEKPENWCQRFYRYGEKFCAVAALAEVVDDIDDAYERLSDAMDGSTISYFNDTHTHAEVLAAFDKAIAAERAKLEAERAS